jgi:hypothetical protein
MPKFINQILVILINDYFHRDNEAEKKKYLSCESKVEIIIEKENLLNELISLRRRYFIFYISFSAISNLPSTNCPCLICSSDK